MAEQETQHAPGGFYSGRNPVPTVKKFMENLDKDKAERDRVLDEEEKQKKHLERHNKHGEAVPHQNKKPSKPSGKEVTDPVTGNKVRIEDVSEGMMKAVENPMVWRLGPDLEWRTIG